MAKRFSLTKNPDVADKVFSYSKNATSKITITKNQPSDTDTGNQYVGYSKNAVLKTSPIKGGATPFGDDSPEGASFYQNLEAAGTEAIWKGSTNLHPESHDFDTGWLLVSQTAATDTQLGIDGRLAFLNTNAVDSGSIHHSRIYDHSNSAWIDGAVVAFANTPTTSWQRESRQFTTPVGCTSIRTYVPMKSNNGTSSRYIINGLTASTEYTFSFYHYVGSADNNVYIDGVQVEAGGIVTPIIPTDGGADSRAATALPYAASNYIDEMSVLCEFEIPRAGDASGVNQYLFSFHDTSGAHLAAAYIDTSGYVNVKRVGSGDYTEVGSANLSANTRYKLAISYSLTGANCAAYLNGTRVDATPADSANSTALTIDEFLVGTNEGGALHLNGEIYNIQVTPIMSANELQSWSSS